MYYSPSLTVYSPQLSLINPMRDQALYTLHQYNQHLQINAQMQALARAQAEVQALLVNNKQMQQIKYLQQQAFFQKESLYDQKINLLAHKDFSQIKHTEYKESLIEKSAPIDMETEIKLMMNYFTKKFNKSNQEEIAQERLKYRHSQITLQIFDELTKKYSSASRCKEDMLRFVLRKALTFLRNRLRNQCVLGARAASLAMCKKYFGPRMNEMLENVDIEDEKEVLAFLLPYKKGSRNRTANSRFTSEIVGSDEFRKDYAYYLEELDGILFKDNQKKVDKLVSFLVDCVKQGAVEKVRTYKRLPWTEEWLASSKVLATELITVHQKDAFSEEIKSEISSSRASS